MYYCQGELKVMYVLITLRKCKLLKEILHNFGRPTFEKYQRTVRIKITLTTNFWIRPIKNINLWVVYRCLALFLRAVLPAIYYRSLKLYIIFYISLFFSDGLNLLHNFLITSETIGQAVRGEGEGGRLYPAMYCLPWPPRQLLMATEVLFQYFQFSFATL